MKKLLTTFGLLLFLFLTNTVVALACTWTAPSGQSWTTPNAIDTGLGCIPTAPDGLAIWFLTYATRIAGGIALILLIFGGIKFITAQGDFKAMEEAKKTVTAALTGLLVIFFAILILRVIGYDILGIPGWGTGVGPPWQLILPQ